MRQNNGRIETDSMGAMAVPADRYWGAQTERRVRTFPSASPAFVFLGRSFARWAW